MEGDGGFGVFSLILKLGHSELDGNFGYLNTLNRDAGGHVNSHTTRD